MIQTKSEDAVSPVIGVMLMLVVTIVIAAVVAVFASGVGMDAEPAPATILTVTNVQEEQKLVTTGKDKFRSYISKDIRNQLTDAGEGAVLEFDGLKLKFKPGTGYVVTESGEELFETDENGEPIYTEPKAAYKDWLYRNVPSNQINKENVEGFVKYGTLTISSKAGETLNTEKLSVKVYDRAGELAAEMPQNTLSGTLNPGDSVVIPLDEIKSTMFKVVILYGEHVVTTEELTVR